VEEKVLKYLGKQYSDIGSVNKTTSIVERAILRNNILIIEWIDKQRNRVFVALEPYKGRKWIGKYEKGESHKEAGSVNADVIFSKDHDSLDIISDIYLDLDESTWIARLKRVDKFPDEKLVLLSTF
jgi:hypothetical protein